jgi:cold shock CspA family protein
LLVNQGLGFVVELDTREEIEFHWTALVSIELDQLQIGQEVEFDKRPDHRDSERTRASHIRLIAPLS